MLWVCTLNAFYDADHVVCAFYDADRVVCAFYDAHEYIQPHFVTSDVLQSASDK